MAETGALKAAVIPAIIGGVVTLGAAATTGALNIGVETQKSQGSIDLEQIRFANSLIERALQNSDARARATELLFYAEIGLLDGLNTQKIKEIANQEQRRIDEDSGGPSFLPALPAGQDRVTITEDIVRAVAPEAPPEIVQTFAGVGNFILAGFGITDTPLRAAHFLAQVAHETGDFRFLEELASGEAFEGRKDLGNTEPGDGIRFKGRGMIQMTGRRNYALFSQQTGIDLMSNPAQASDPATALLVAAAYWNSRNLNQYADQDDIRRITRWINGGTYGLDNRTAKLELAKTALGLDQRATAIAPDR